jgi:hypothetical protein
MAGLTEDFVRLVRRIVGLPEDEGAPPDLMRLGLYRARVDTCASDGSTMDVTPDDRRISPEKNVPMRVGLPGATMQVQPGAVVLLGWEKGDPSKPYCAPHWEQGATVLKLTLSATEVDITGNTVLKLNGGTLGVARQTDPISSATAGPFAVSPQIIQSGSTTVKAG